MSLAGLTPGIAHPKTTQGEHSAPAVAADDVSPAGHFRVRLIATSVRVNRWPPTAVTGCVVICPG